MYPRVPKLLSCLPCDFRVGAGGGGGAQVVIVERAGHAELKRGGGEGFVGEGVVADEEDREAEDPEKAAQTRSDLAP